VDYECELLWSDCLGNVNKRIFVLLTPFLRHWSQIHGEITFCSFIFFCRQGTNCFHLHCAQLDQHFPPEKREKRRG